MTNMFEHDRRGMIPVDFEEKNPKLAYSIALHIERNSGLMSHVDSVIRHIEVHNVELLTGNITAGVVWDTCSGSGKAKIMLHVNARWVDLLPALDDLISPRCGDGITACSVLREDDGELVFDWGREVHPGDAGCITSG